MSDDQDHARRGGDDGTERALDELRVALEQLAARMGAGFREDLAQIRAIAASVAERDLTAEVEALRIDVATLIGRDSTAELRDDVASLRAELDRFASREDVTLGVAPLHATLDRISSRLDDDSGRTQVLARFEALETRLDQLAGSDGNAEVLARIDALSARLDALPTAQQLTNLPADLRAHLADGLAGFDGDAVMREIAGVRRRLGDGDGTLLEQLQDNLADVASGEVVGALWDEVRQLRSDLPELVPAPEPVVPSREPDPQLATLTDELAVLRTELAEGLVVEPSDALSNSLDALRAEIDELRGALGELRSQPEPVDGREEQLLGQLESIRTSVDAVRSRLDAAEEVTRPAPTDRAEIAAIVADQVSSLRTYVGSELDTVRQALQAVVVDVPAASQPADDGRDERLLEELDTIRTGLDQVRSRLDGGVSLADGELPPVGDVADRAAVEGVADQVASLRELVASELDGLRSAVAEQRTAPEPVDDGRDERLLERLGAVQAGIEEVRTRLDEGVALAEEAERPAMDDEPDRADIDTLADQVAALRDFIASELDTMSQTVTSRLDAAAEATAATVAAAAAQPADQPVGEVQAGIDPETVAMLRDEIRAAGAIGDQVVDALRGELKALRRRIAVKASERVLDDQQLTQIADVVAARLAQDGEKG